LYSNLQTKMVTGEHRFRVWEALEKAVSGEELSAEDGETLLAAEGDAMKELVEIADHIRQERVGDVVTYVVNRNINFTNICVGRCRFCAFRKSPGHPEGYRLSLEEIAEKVKEAVREGATEVCIQGGLNPEMTFDDYLNILGAVREVSPDIHIHAFSPAEIDRMTRMEGISVRRVLSRLREAGLNSVPGTAAEVFSARVRSLICPEKISAERWAEIIKACHRINLPTTSTVLYGNVETPKELAEHIAFVREIQRETMGFTEFIPLRFKPFNTDLWRMGFREWATLGYSLKVHAVGRIMLSGYIDNIQASWVKLGPRGAQLMLKAGANDLGGTLMEDNITRAAGGRIQRMSVFDLRKLALEINRTPRQRTTTYGLL